MSHKQYKQLNKKEREEIRYLCVKHGYSVRETADLLDRDPSTISRELRRNKGPTGQYGATTAHRMAADRRYSKSTGMVLKNSYIRTFVERCLLQGWSPEQIAGRLSLEHSQYSISHEAIYLYVYQEARKGRSHLCKSLYSRRIKRRDLYRKKSVWNSNNKVTPCKAKDKTPIDMRPKDINDRIGYKDWEMDLIIGKRQKSALCVLLERKSRFVIIEPLVDRSARSMCHVVISALGGLPRQMRRSITADNGSENADHHIISRTLGTAIYFCEPYKSWQKGAIENMNGIIRRKYPKGTDFYSIYRHDIVALQKKINTTPRKCLGYRTSQEVFDEAIEGYS